jgi:Arc/MetJ-type ribon-helix-helix transcriptional regulator
MTIVLNPEMERRIARLVESGQYHSAEEVIGESLDLLKARDADSHSSSEGGKGETIWEMATRITASVPDEEWAKLPTDLSINLDHYLYGAPKVSE